MEDPAPSGGRKRCSRAERKREMVRRLENQIDEEFINQMNMRRLEERVEAIRRES